MTDELFIAYDLTPALFNTTGHCSRPVANCINVKGEAIGSTGSLIEFLIP